MMSHARCVVWALVAFSCLVFGAGYPLRAVAVRATACRTIPETGGPVHFGELSAYDIAQEPVGARVASIYVSVTFSCSVADRLRFVRHASPDVHYGPDSGMALTNVAGLDIKMIDRTKNRVIPVGISPPSSAFPVVHASTHRLELQVIKVGPVATGHNLDFTEHQRVVDSAGHSVATGQFPFIVTTNVAQLPKEACVFLDDEAQDLNVVMPTVSPRAFTGVGSYTGLTDFSVVLQCLHETPVSIKFTGDIDPNFSKVGVFMGHAAAMQARGVGVQILYEDEPVAVNAFRKLSPLKDGVSRIPFQARYYQLRSQIEPGILDVHVIFTMSFE